MLGHSTQWVADGPSIFSGARGKIGNDDDEPPRPVEGKQILDVDHCLQQKNEEGEGQAHNDGENREPSKDQIQERLHNSSPKANPTHTLIRLQSWCPKRPVILTPAVAKGDPTSTARGFDRKGPIVKNGSRFHP